MAKSRTGRRAALPRAATRRCAARGRSCENSRPSCRAGLAHARTNPRDGGALFPAGAAARCVAPSRPADCRRRPENGLRASLRGCLRGLRHRRATDDRDRRKTHPRGTCRSLQRQAPRSARRSGRLRVRDNASDRPRRHRAARSRLRDQRRCARARWHRHRCVPRGRSNDRPRRPRNAASGCDRESSDRDTPRA